MVKNNNKKKSQFFFFKLCSSAPEPETTGKQTEATGKEKIRETDLLLFPFTWPPP